MAVAINFDKAKAERFLEGLSKGKALGAMETVDDVLALAGACFFMAMSQGGALHQGVDWSKVPGGQPEDVNEDTFIQDIHAAIEYYAQLFLLVADGAYDENFDEQHRAIVLLERGKKTVVPVEGMRGDLMTESSTP